jgi:hypothetical protein
MSVEMYAANRLRTVDLPKGIDAWGSVGLNQRGLGEKMQLLGGRAKVRFSTPSHRLPPG